MIGALTVEQGSLSQYNLFVYCLNNPVNMVDYGGDIPQSIIKDVLRLTARTATSMFGRKWYYAAKSMIAAAGNAFLASKKYHVARALFNNAMWGGGRTISQSTRKLIINALNASEYFNEQIRMALQNVNGIIVNKMKVAMNFTTGDLYYGIGKIDFYLTGLKKNGKWTVKISGTDRYDFDEIRSFSRLSFGSAANDLGWAMQRIGMSTVYSWSVSFSRIY